MATTQAQYQIRLTVGDPGDCAGDIVVWADAFDTEVPDFPVEKRVSLRNRLAVANWIVSEQTRRNARTAVLVVVAPPETTSELPVAHLAVAGALIEALSDAGLDHTSPEAAAALAAWLGIKPARKHLLGATTAARMLAAAGRRDIVDAALELDAD